MKAILASAAIGAGLAFAAASASAGTFEVRYEAEQPGVATAGTSATFKSSAGALLYGVETFDDLATGAHHSITFDPGGTISASYAGPSGVDVIAADQYGGAGGAGKYVAALPGQPYTLTISTPGVDYFGFWLSALDKGNSVTFYGESGQALFTFNPQDVINAIHQLPASQQSAYFGNPFDGGKDSNEPFIFLNFFDVGGSFSKVVFTQTWSGGHYESDNHTLGVYDTMGEGIPVALLLSTTPEPSTWAMLLLGFAGLAFAGYRGRRSPISITGA